MEKMKNLMNLLHQRGLEWLCDMLKGWNEASAKDFASLIINEAIKRRNDGYDDDITAIAINIIDLTAA